MAMTELDAVNAVLRELGEQPLPSIDDQYPTLDLVLPALERSRVDLLAEGWFFNVFYNYQILPDTSGNIVVPDATLTFVPHDRDLLWSGKYVRQSDGGLIFTKPVVGTRYADLPFIELPHYAQQCVVLGAAAQVYSQDFGIDQKYQELASRFNAAHSMLGRDHVRQRKVNVRDRPVVRRLYRDLMT